MGADASKTSILPPRKPGEASEFYWACRNGNVETVRKMLPNMTYEQVNQIEPNGSTALHAACFYNHPQVVHLLLASGCSRTTVNFNGNTAYQEASDNQIRALFNRPTTNRFIDEHLTDSFILLTANGEKVVDEVDIPDDWVKGHTSADAAYGAKAMLALANSSGPLEKIVKNQVEVDSTKNLSALVSKAVPRVHKEYTTMRNLLNKFFSKTSIQNLLTMYTLETPFYSVLHNEAVSYTSLLYIHLHQLQNRAYQGRTYRGAKMTQNDIGAYRWALNRPGYVLETRKLQSTSLNKSMAQQFAAIQNSAQTYNLYSVLLTLDFPQKCPTAINLNKISETLPALSAFEHEEEILVLPFTLFIVREIKIDSKSNQYRITLTNVPTPKSSVSAAVKHIE